jgi:chemotaxis protein methyltransferase CheR
MSIAVPQFDYLRRIVRQHSAIVIDADKDYLVDSRLSPLAEREGFGSIHDLIVELEKQPFGPRHRRVVDAMTNNETWFFRDFQPFEAIRQKILPELLERRSRTQPIVAWSAACSSGQEPYTLAMCLMDDFRASGRSVSIIATDLAEHILDRARSGIYSQMEVSRGLPAPLLARHFAPCGARWQLKPEIRKMVEFRQMNLIAPWPNMPRVDLLMLRNVLIYFDVSVKKSILANVKRVLQPDGYMFLGAAETTLNIDDDFERVPYSRGAYYRLRSRA